MKHATSTHPLRSLSVLFALAISAANAAAGQTHVVTFRRLNGTVLSRVQVENGGSVAAPEGPVEPDHTFKGWDHGDWLGCVTNDIQVWALYEGTKVWDAGTGYGSQSIAERDIPYSLEEYFQMYDNMAWADEFSREGTNDVRSTYWNYDTENRNQLNYETSGDNQKEIDGFLDINVRREKKTRREFDWSTLSYKTTEYDFTGGGLKSNGKVAFKHGRCEIRAKLTRQRGAWPAFWMMGNTGNWPECGELDVLEQPSGGDWIAGTFHLPMPGVNGGSIPNGHPTTPEDGVHFGDGFHRFGTIVNEREVVWYVDDHIFKRMDVRDSRYDMLRDRPLFIIFGMGLQSNTWVKATGDAPVNKNDVPELDERGVDFLVDYCRIFTNTNAGNTASYEAAPAQARLSAPVTAAIWRGWDMTWGRPGSGAYQNNINKGYTERYYIKTALSEYFAREKTDVLTFLTEPTISTSANRAEFDIPDYSSLSISANANGWNSSDNPKLESGSYSNGRLPLFSSVLFNSKRFSVSSSCIDILKLSDEPAFTNCYAVCADLKEKATDARVKVISVNVIATNGVETAGSTVAQGFNTLFTTLDAVKDENVIVLLQGMDQKLLNYIKARADTALASPYHYLGNYSGTLTYQCAYATASVAASAKHPDPILVPKEAPSVSYTHNPQALQATVTFDAPIATDDGLSDTFDAATYAKSMTISFPDYTGAALSSFPVLVRLSTAISGFDYTGFLLPDGGDLRFTDASGNVIPHEVDTWNPDGESTVWVKVPLLTKSAAITAHWGCPRPVRPGAEGVWDGDYVGVWHLGESGLPLRESSGVSVDFTRSTGDSVVFAAGGIVGGAVDFVAAGRTNSVVALDNAALEGLARGTLEVWTKQVSHTQNAGILSKRAGYNSNISYFIYDNGSSTVLCLPGDTIGSNYVSCVSTTPAMNAWNHQAFTFDTAAASDNAKSYLNGLSKTPATKSVAAFSGIANLCLGAMQGGTAANYVGQIDEVRISKCVRSADWIQATHDTVAKANFATYAVDGAEPPPEPAFSLSAAVAPGFAWTNGTATVSAAVTNGVAVPEGAVVRMTISDASGAVLGTADRAWTGDGEYAFDTAEAVSGAALSGYDYTLSFSVLPGSAGVQPAETSAALRLGSAAPWFSADPATGEITGGAWSGDGGDAVSTSDSLFVLSGGAAFIADASRDGLVRAEIALPSNSLVSETSLPTLLAFAAEHGERAGLAPVDGGDGTILWHGLVRQDGALAWKELQGGGGLQTAGSVTPIAMELDLTVPAAPRVSYLANGARLRDATGAEWFPAPGTATAAEGVIDFHGGGSVGALAGYAYDKAVAETSDGTRHATLAEALAAGDAKLLTNVEWPEGAPVGTTAIDRDGHTLLQGGVAVEESSVVVTAGPVAIAGEGTLRVTFPKLDSVGVATAGRTPAQIAADLAAAGANGIPRWQSLVLGLDAADPDALPLADIAVDSASGTVSVSDAGLAVDESTGATVTYQVREIPDLADPSADVPVGDPAAPGEPVALPMGDAAARFFRIQVRIALP